MLCDRAHRFLGHRDLLRQRQDQTKRVLGDAFLVGAGLVQHDDARFGAVVDVDHVIAGTGGTDRQHVRDNQRATRRRRTMAPSIRYAVGFDNHARGSFRSGSHRPARHIPGARGRGRCGRRGWSRRPGS